MPTRTIAQIHSWAKVIDIWASRETTKIEKNDVFEKIPVHVKKIVQTCTIAHFSCNRKHKVLKILWWFEKNYPFFGPKRSPFFTLSPFGDLAFLTFPFGHTSIQVCWCKISGLYLTSERCYRLRPLWRWLLLMNVRLLTTDCHCIAFHLHLPRRKWEKASLISLCTKRRERSSQQQVTRGHSQSTHFLPFLLLSL